MLFKAFQRFCHLKDLTDSLVSQHLARKHVCNHGEDSSQLKHPLEVHKDLVMMKSPHETDLSGKCGKRVRA